MNQVFVSYSRKDASFVSELQRALEKAGISAWVDRERLVGGTEWIDSLADAMDACAAVVLVISPDAVRSEWVRREISFAARRGIKVIPLMYRDTAIPPVFDFMVGGTQRIDFTAGSLEGPVNALTAAIELLESTKIANSEEAAGSRKELDLHIEDVSEFLDEVSPLLVWRFNRRNYTPLAATIFRTYIATMTTPIVASLLNLLAFSLVVIAMNLVFPYPHDLADDVVAVLVFATGASFLQWLISIWVRRNVKSALPKAFPDLTFRPNPGVPNILLDRWEESVKPIILQLLDEPVGSWEDYLERRVKDEELIARVSVCVALLAGLVLPE